LATVSGIKATRRSPTSISRATANFIQSSLKQDSSHVGS
jgi:hypothetical protein